MEPPQRDLQAAAAAVEAAAGEKGWTVKDLATAARIDPATVTDFLSARRWPRMNTRGSLERALGWPAGTIARVAAGGTPPTDAAPDEDDGTEELAVEARRLTDRQRAALLELVRAVADPGDEQAQPVPRADPGQLIDLARPPQPDLSRVAARRGTSEGRLRREAQDIDAEPQDPSHPSHP